MITVRRKKIPGTRKMAYAVVNYRSLGNGYVMVDREPQPGEPATTLHGSDIWQLTEQVALHEFHNEVISYWKVKKFKV